MIKLMFTQEGGGAGVEAGAFAWCVGGGGGLGFRVGVGGFVYGVQVGYCHLPVTG